MTKQAKPQPDEPEHDIMTCDKPICQETRRILAEGDAGRTVCGTCFRTMDGPVCKCGGQDAR